MAASRPRVSITLAATIALGVCAASPCRPARGDVGAVPPMMIGPSTAGTALSRFDDATQTQSDILFGRNLKGPYTLSWNGIRINSDSVQRNGLSLQRGTDYKLDTDKGQISFSTVLRPDEMVRVVYRCDTSVAAPNKTQMTVPVQLDLLQLGSNRILFQTSVSPYGTTGNQDPNSLLSSLAFVGGAHILSTSDLSAAVAVDLRGGDWLGRSGIQFGDHTKLRNADLAFTYQRAGATFVPQDGIALATGREIMEGKGAFTPLRYVSFSSIWRQTTQILDPAAPSGSSAPSSDRGSVTQEAQNSIAVALPHNQGKVALNQDTTITSQPDGSVTSSSDNKMQVDKTLAKGTQTTVAFEQQSTQSTPAGTSASPAVTQTYTQTTSVKVQSQPVPQVTIKGSFADAQGGASAQDTDSVQIDATPVTKLKQLKLSADMADQVAPTGATRKREATLALPPLPLAQAQLTGGVRQTSSPTGERLVELMDATTHPLRYLQVSGGMRWRDGLLTGNAPDPDAVTTYNAAFALSPGKRLKLTGSLARNPESSDGSVRHADRRAVGLETDLGLLAFKGNVGLEDDFTASTLTNTLDLSLDLRLTKFDTLSTGYQRSSVFASDPTLTHTYKLSFTHHLGTAIDLSLGGTMTDRSTTTGAVDQDPDIKGEAKVGLKF